MAVSNKNSEAHLLALISDFRYATISTNYDGTDMTLPSTCVSSFEPSVAFMIPGTDSETTTLDWPVVAVARIITVLWEEANLKQFPESLAASLRVGMGLPATPSTSDSPTRFQPSGIPPPTAPASPSDEPAPHLSGGVIAGIVVGAVTFISALGILGYFAIARRWKKNRAYPDNPSEGPSPKSLSLIERILHWRKPIPPHPEIAEMETGNNIYKYFSGGAWRSELQGNNQPPSTGDGANALSVSDASHDSHRMSRYSKVTAVNPISMELEGSMPVTQHQPPIAETDENVEDISHSPPSVLKEGSGGDSSVSRAT